MALDTSGDATKILKTLNDFIAAGSTPGVSTLVVIAQILDTGFQLATPSETNVDISPPAGSLKFPPVFGKQLLINIGLECARYWSAAKAPGSPVSRSSISLSNDAAKIAAPITANLTALCYGGYQTPYYFNFVDAIHKEVKTVVWKVTESNALGSTNYVVTVT